MAIIYAPTSETFKGGVNNVYFNGERQCHVGIEDSSSEVKIAYDCNTACVNIYSLRAQITDWALEARAKPAYWGECQVRLRYWWYECPTGCIMLCDCWHRDTYLSPKRIYTTTSYFRPNTCFCACIYGYGCSPRHFVASAPFGNYDYVSCFMNDEDYVHVGLSCGGSWAYTDWQDISCWEYDLLYNVDFRPDITVYSYPSYSVTTCIRGKNPDGSYYYCGPVGDHGNLVLDH